MLINKPIQAALDNYRDVIATQRNLEFFTVAYRFLIQVRPAVAAAIIICTYFVSNVCVEAHHTNNTPYRWLIR